MEFCLKSGNRVFEELKKSGQSKVVFGEEEREVFED